MKKKVEKTILPRESGWEEDDGTRAIRDDEVVVSSASVFRDRTRVRICLVKTNRTGPESAGDIGEGYLVDALAIGRSLRIATGSSPAFVTSPVRGLQRLGPDAIQIVTANSVYRLERAREQVPEGEGARRPLVPSRARRLETLRRQALGASSDRIDSPTPTPRGEDSTSFVSLSKLAPVGTDPFADARIRISRIKTRDPGSERLGDLGPGRVLDRLEVGEMVRLSVDGGPTFVTSPLRAIRRLGERIVEIETANSTYRLEKLEGLAS